jgi:hypothetical protein
MCSESWRRVVSLTTMQKIFPAQKSSGTGAFDAEMAEKLATAVETLDVRRQEQEAELRELHAVSTSTGGTEQAEASAMLAISKREGELHRTEEHLGAGMDEWGREVGPWVDINVAEWLASYVLAELKQEKLGNGDFKYKCLHSAGPGLDHRQGDSELIDRKFLAYLRSRTSRYVIALQSGCRSKVVA